MSNFKSQFEAGVAQFTSQSNLSAAQVKAQHKKTSDQVSMRLFYEGSYKQRLKEKDLQQAKLIQQEIELAENQDKPCINRISRMIAATKPGRRS